MRVAIVGSGYVGLTAAAGLASLGHEVRCVDVVPERVAAIGRGETPFYEPGLGDLLAAALARGNLVATTNLVDAVARSEITMITVGTPQGPSGIDLSFVEAAARGIGRALRDAPGYHVIVVKSTVVPGTTDSVVRPAIERESGREAGEFGLCVNPEFLREGHAVADFLDPDRLVVGQWDQRSGEAMAQLYRAFDCPTVFTTLRNAEMIKYASNTFLATLVSFSNEIAALCEATPGADVQTVLRGLHLDRRLSPVVNGRRITPGILSYLWAGCGFGGSCLPKDVNALRAWARERLVDVPILDAVMTVNEQRPRTLVNLTEKAVGSLDGASIAVLGLAFKPGSDDVRKSPAFPVIRELRKRRATVRVFDPLLTAGPLSPELVEALGPGVEPCATGTETLRGADAAVLVTGWPEFAAWDWTEQGRLMRRAIVVDGRNALVDVRWPDWARYVPVGRASESVPTLMEVI